MKLKQLLEEFYTQNNIPKDGGVSASTFTLTLFGVPLKFPNPEFRKKIIHIHDLQHVLNDCDTSWKGEAYISGWEISTGMWKYFPVALFSFWAVGYSFWMYPKSVYEGFKSGLNRVGIIDLPYTKDEFLSMDLTDLDRVTNKSKKATMNVKNKLLFVFWILVCELFFLAPFLITGFILL